MVCPVEIPQEMGNYEELIGLDISENQLSGETPSELGDLDNLTSLNLAENRPSGKIPAWLADVGESSRSVKLYSNEFECAPSTLKG